MHKIFCSFIIILISLLLTCCLRSPEKTPLMLAASQGDMLQIKRLMQNTNNINIKDKIGFDALLYAIKYDQAETSKYLLAHGANPNSKDNRGTTAFIMAASVGNIETIKILHDHGAILDQANQAGITALMAAAGSGNLDVVNLLLTYGANPCLKDKNAHTALQTAEQWWGSSEMQQEINSNPLLNRVVCVKDKHD